LAAALALTAVSGVPAFAAKRVALVIGNSAYKEARRLPNPANDASAIADLFHDAGFDVVAKHDVGISDLRRTLREFTTMTQDAEIAVVYSPATVSRSTAAIISSRSTPFSRDTDVDDVAVSLDRVMHTVACSIGSASSTCR
jgi:uncharacterized caspase-like protein